MFTCTLCKKRCQERSRCQQNSSWCKSCRRKKWREYYANDPEWNKRRNERIKNDPVQLEKKRARQRAYYQRNKEARLAADKVRHENNRDGRLEYFHKLRHGPVLGPLMHLATKIEKETRK